MPRPGGPAGKIGNSYEAIWTVHILIGVVERRINAVTIEPPGISPLGIEFIVENVDGSHQYHSVKRQKTGGDWSIAKLCHSAKSANRTILGDLFHSWTNDPRSTASFVSSTGSNELRELAERANSETDLSSFERNLSPELRAKFHKYIVPVCKAGEAVAFSFLRSLEVVLFSHQQLVRTVDQRIDSLFYRHDGPPLHATQVRLGLAEYVLDNLGTRIDYDQTQSFMASCKLGLRDWKRDPTINATVTSINDRYMRAAQAQFINSAPIERDVVAEMIDHLRRAGSKGALLVAPGGYGKSCVLAQCVSCLSSSQIPYLCFRIDSLNHCTSRQIGAQLDLPASPAVVLGGVAENAMSVLIVDQLDAMSVVSGRSTALWEPFSELCDEVRQYPNMKLVLACRDFDLNHDYRLRTLAGSNSQFSKYTIEKLSRAEVVQSLKIAGRHNDDLTNRQSEILGVPYHLFLFLHGQPERGFTTAGQLFDSYWEQKRRILRQRLGRPSEWAQVIDTLTAHMSSRQTLIAPKSTVDTWAEDAEAMVSEHVLIEERGQYRFFHESFFDYAYARGFGSRSLVEFLTSSEQNLFQRSQVRQILDYRRENDVDQYIADVRDVLTSDQVRFHIRRMVASGFRRVDCPTDREWRVLVSFIFEGDLSASVLSALYGHLGWFDLLYSLGVFREWLASGNDQQEDAAIYLLQAPMLHKDRSSKIAGIVAPYHRLGKKWVRRIVRVMSWRTVHFSKEMMSLHLKMIADGTYDHHESFWDEYHGLDRECPEFFIDIVKVWFDRSIARFDNGSDFMFLDTVSQNKSTSGVSLIRACAERNPGYYATQILPLVTSAILRTEVVDDNRVRDRLWLWLFNSKPYNIDEAILLYLRVAMQKLAENDADTFRELVEPIIQLPHETLGYLLLSSWRCNSREFADECIRYLLADTRRLSIGYVSWIGGNDDTGLYAIGRRAVAASSPFCDSELFTAIERAIVSYLTSYEVAHPKSRGHAEFLLLCSLDESRTSARTKARVAELGRKFVETPVSIVAEDVESRMELVDSPISADRAKLMTDDQWLSALRKYDAPDEGSLMGTRTMMLSRILTDLTRRCRVRFASLLVNRMTNDIQSTYFSAIVDGLSGRFLANGADKRADIEEMGKLSTATFMDVIDRVHSLPGRPCGSAIVHCVGALADRDMPPSAVATVSYYAMHDPDPREDVWRDGLYRDDPYFYGMNTVRGQAAEAIGTLLQTRPARLAGLYGALVSLSRDPMVAARACAIDALTCLLRISPDVAVELFISACTDCDDLWPSHPFERFIYDAVNTHYENLRPLLQAVLRSDDERAVAAVSRQIVLAELNDVDVATDCQRIRAGSDAMRKAAADIYSQNVLSERVGDYCMQRLIEFFSDKKVEEEISSVFNYSNISGEWLLHSKNFILKYIDSAAFDHSPGGLLRAIEESNVRMPEVICEAAERALRSIGMKGAHLALAESAVAMTIATLVVRQYQQTDDDDIRTRCLDLIDRMERMQYFGIDRELEKLER